MKIYSFAIVFLCAIVSFGQSHKGAISKIETNGLHKIELPQNVRAASTDNCNFIRLKDSKNNQVPYVLMDGTDKIFKTYTGFDILSNIQIKDSITSIIFQHKNNSLDQLVLKIANTKINKSYTVFGSHNKTDWYGLVSNKQLFNLNSNTETYVEKQIDLPLNTYKFIKLELNNKSSIPVNILDVGIYENTYFKQDLTKISSYSQEITLNAKTKTTEIKFSVPKASKVDAISFNVTTDYFLRNAKITITKERKIKKRIETYKQTLNQFQLNSEENNTFSLYGLNETDFTIEISNQDNPALDIKEITLFQKPKYIVANLNKNEIYTIEVDSTLKKPNYDLKNFVNKTSTDINEAKVLNFTALKNTSIKTANKSFWETKFFMWLCILSGGIIVVYFALSLLKDIGKG
jgi:hypothetical protein